MTRAGPRQRRSPSLHLGGTASADTDYLAPAAGDDSRRLSEVDVVVTPVDDNEVESAESVALTLLADATYSVGAPASATLTIVSDEPIRT